jgi:hypothetical protein
MSLDIDINRFYCRSGFPELSELCIGQARERGWRRDVLRGYDEETYAAGHIEQRMAMCFFWQCNQQ